MKRAGKGEQVIEKDREKVKMSEKGGKRNMSEKELEKSEQNREKGREKVKMILERSGKRRT